MAQVYEGRERIFELFRETRRLTGGTYLSRAEVGAERRRARGRRLPRARQRRGRELDIDQVLLIDHTDGIWQRIVAIPSDPPAFEAFWAV